MKKYNFDIVPERRGTGCIKFDGMEPFYGTNDLLPMWIADMDFAVADEIAAALRSRAEHPVYGYAFAPDSYWESIIAWLKERHHFNVAREELRFIPGIVKGIGIIINYFTQKGDVVVIQPPVYHPFRRLAEGNERRVVENPLIPTPEGYRMDLEGLERIFAEEKPKLMVLCNPHNPVGIQWEEEVLKEVARLARKYGVIVVSDEIHADLMLDGRPHIPYLACGEDAEATGIMFGAPSKTFNIPGLVSSWIVIKSPELRDSFYHWLEVNEFDAPTQFATLATEAAYRFGADWLDQALAYVEGNIEFMDKYLRANMPELSIVRPQASYLVWLDLRKLGLDAERRKQLLEKEAGLAVNDGAMFGTGGEGFVRFNVGTSRIVLAEALGRLREAINKI